MTDSESDTPNFFGFQNVNTTVSARGPNTNISNFSFRNPLTSTMWMPRNFERPGYTESVSDQRSIYYRRETSPMSMHSAIQPRNFQHCYGGVNSQHPRFIGRSGSPLSMRSINSNASVSAADIAFAFQNVKFNKYDLKVIKDAYKKLVKHGHRKRVEKRRNLRMFLKGGRSRPGGDSGDQGSNSSISSDDCRSVQTSYQGNIPHIQLSRIDPVPFRKTVGESNMVKDCTESFRQNSFKNMLSIGGSNFNRKERLNSTSNSTVTQSTLTQKDRFNNRFVLPSQRFNRTVTSTVIPERSEREPQNKENIYKSNPSYVENRTVNSGSEEEIFPANVGNSGVVTKRTFDGDDSSLPEKKKIKVFKKPQPPPLRSKVSNQPKAKSYVAPVEPIVSPNKQECNKTVQTQNEQCDENSEVSMRPSFIKRKLFTQKLDVVEKKNENSDAVNSPQNVYSTLQKEKNKTRKLVTNQSCMYREVQDDNNLMDLIHKIVPPDCINKTNQTIINQTQRRSNNLNKKDDEDTWDVTSVLSMCDENNVSDTFTDEDIFEKGDTNGRKQSNKSNSTKQINRADSTKQTNKADSTKQTNRADSTKQTNRADSTRQTNKVDSTKQTNKVDNIKQTTKADSTKQISKPITKTVPLNTTQPCMVVCENIPKSQIVQHSLSKTSLKNPAKNFWETDFESDAELHVNIQRNNLRRDEPANVTLKASGTALKHPLLVPQRPEAENELQDSESLRLLHSKNPPVMNKTMDSTRKVNSTLSVKLREPKKKKCGINIGFQEIHFKNPSKTNNDITNLYKDSSNSVLKSKSTFKDIDNASACVTKPKELVTKLNNKKETTMINTVKSKPKNANVSKNFCKTKNENSKATKTRSKLTPKSCKSNDSSSRLHSRTTKQDNESKLNKINRKDIVNQTLKDRPVRACRSLSRSLLTDNSRSSQQFAISPLQMTLRRTPKKKVFYDSSFFESTGKTRVRK